MKLKSFLRKHKDLELNFTQGKKHRGPLHIVCSHGDDAILRLLLKRGADPLQTDRNGETPLHLAAKRALKHGKRGMRQCSDIYIKKIFFLSVFNAVHIINRSL